jgi:hypothetical protein
MLKEEIMKRIKISLILLGHSDNLFSVNKVKNWKSDLFEINCIQRIKTLPDSEINDSFLDQKYCREQIEGIVDCPEQSDIAFGIMGYRFIDNFYLHRIKDKCVVLSLYGINEILTRNLISIENFIIKNIYEIIAIKWMFGNISTDEVYSIAHRDTRGCLFDFNGDRQDIIYNTEKPRLCDACKSSFNKKQIDENLITRLKNELLKINKPRIQRVEIFIKKFPLFSIFLSGIIAIILNLIANMLWELLK